MRQFFGATPDPCGGGSLAPRRRSCQAKLLLAATVCSVRPASWRMTAGLSVRFVTTSSSFRTIRASSPTMFGSIDETVATKTPEVGLAGE